MYLTRFNEKKLNKAPKPKLNEAMSFPECAESVRGLCPFGSAAALGASSSAAWNFMC